MMYGKHFASMYKGSMYGAGPVFFAVMGYIIANTNKSRIEINPRELANILGATQEEVEKVIEKMTGPDPRSRNKEHEGRKLLQEGEFQYFVTGWEKYQAIKNEDQRREANKQSQRRHREKVNQKKRTPNQSPPNGPPVPEIRHPVVNDECAGQGVVASVDGWIKGEQSQGRNENAEEQPKPEEKIPF